MQINAHDMVDIYLPLLRHAQNDLILDTALSVATIIGGAHNINIAVGRVAKITYALKSFSRIDQSAERIQADLKDGIDTVLTIYQATIRQGIDLIKNYQDIPALNCFPDELIQVWTNLIHNALQAMNNKGQLTVALFRQGSDAIVEITDSGCGIPEDIREKIFQPFFTTKPVGEGSGLGLDIVTKIINKHNGRIDVHSTVGVGTRFTIYLPYETGELDDSSPPLERIATN